MAYSVKPKYWRKGFASEMTSVVKTFAEDSLKLERLISIIHVDNLASKKVAEKNGMCREQITTYLNMPVEIFVLKVNNQIS